MNLLFIPNINLKQFQYFDPEPAPETVNTPQNRQDSSEQTNLKTD